MHCKGSRIFGYATPTSDYDVKFIFVRNKLGNYISTGEAKEDLSLATSAIDATGQKVEIDAVGWDVTKAFRLLRLSNPSIIEWSKIAQSGLHPPYRDVGGFGALLASLCDECTDFRRLEASWRSQALKSVRERVCSGGKKVIGGIIQGSIDVGSEERSAMNIKNFYMKSLCNLVHAEVAAKLGVYPPLSMLDAAQLLEAHGHLPLDVSAAIREVAGLRTRGILECQRNPVLDAWIEEIMIRSRKQGGSKGAEIGNTASANSDEDVISNQMHDATRLCDQALLGVVLMYAHRPAPAQGLTE